MGLKTILSRIFRSPVVQTLAPLALGAFAPQFLPLLNLSLRAILTAEDKFGEKTGPQKAEYVADQIFIAAPLVVTAIENATGKELADEALFSEGMKDLNNALVKILNAFRLLPK